MEVAIPLHTYRVLLKGNAGFVCPLQLNFDIYLTSNIDLKSHERPLTTFSSMNGSENLIINTVHAASMEKQS